MRWPATAAPARGHGRGQRAPALGPTPRRSRALAACLLGANGCGSTGFTPRLGTETSHDGLVKVENARVSAARLRPDFDLASYHRVKLEGAGIAYRPLRGMGGSGGEFPVSASAQRRLREILEEEFRSALRKSKRFEPTEEIGPDVLVVWAGLLDVIAHAPPEPAGRETVYLARSWAGRLRRRLDDAPTLSGGAVVAE